MIITPLTFLGGSFYSVDMLPPACRHAVQPDRLWSAASAGRSTGIADVHVGVSLGATSLFLVILLAIVAWMFRTGYKLKN